MALTPEDLIRLSTLLEEAIDLDAAGREAWLSRIVGEDSRLLAMLRKLLATPATRATDDLLDRGPSFSRISDDDGPADAGFGLAPGDRVGPYRLIRELGVGGMAVVWLAERADNAFTRTVALKLPQQSRLRRDLAERFRRERDILARLEHPHIARLYDAGVSDDGLPYLSLEYVEGNAITTYCDAARLGVQARLALFAQVLEAVHYAHTHLVIHRDLKPANILVNEQGGVRLLDFGVAKLLAEEEEAPENQLTRNFGRAMTPNYASPEQLLGKSLTTATDVYSLGVVLYELLCGRLPYRVKSGSAAQMEAAILGMEPRRLKAGLGSGAEAEATAARRSSTALRLARDLSGDLGTIVIKALAKPIDERYASCEALGEDLRRYRDGQPVKARPDSVAYQLRKFAARNALLASATGMLALAIVSGAGLAIWEAGKAREQAAKAEREASRAKAVQDFLLELFQANSDRQADPLKARQLTARELLDIGRERVGQKLKDSPEAQDAVLETLAQMYVDVGFDDRSAELYGQLAALRERRYGPDDLRVAEALMHQAMTLHAAAGTAPALALMRRVEAIFKASPDAPAEMRIDMHRAFVDVLRYADVSEAVAHNEAARQLVQAHGAQPAALRRLNYAEALMLESLGDCSGALAAGERAMAVVVPDIDAPQWQIPELTALHSAAYCLGDLAAAEGYLRRALAVSVRANGPEHIDTGHVQARLMRLLHDTSRPGDADAAETALITVLNTPPGQSNLNLRSIAQRNLAWRELERGRIDPAEQRLAEQAAERRKYSGEGTVLSFALQLWGRALTAQRHFGPAAERLDEALAMKRRVLGPQARPAAFALLVVDRAAVELEAGDAEAALRRLAELDGPATAAPREFRFASMRAAELRARAMLRLGKVDAAADAADSGLAMLRANQRPIDYPRLHADLLLQRGQARSLQQRHDEALADLVQALDLRRANDDQESPWLAQTATTLAAARRAAGQRPLPKPPATH